MGDPVDSIKLFGYWEIIGLNGVQTDSATVVLKCGENSNLVVWAPDKKYKIFLKTDSKVEITNIRIGDKIDLRTKILDKDNIVLQQFD